jgi:hypothetical protein
MFLFNFLNLLRKIVKDNPHIKREKINEGKIDISITDWAVSGSLL